jgi:RHS repeat-associated protein
VQQEYAYEPYGEVASTGSSDNPYQYTGREKDGSGLYYYRARYYSPTLKRFISEDPIGLEGGLNSYAYVNGRPVEYTDPLGLYHYNEQETSLWLQIANNEATYGPDIGLLYIFENSLFRYDFGYTMYSSDDTWTFCGQKMNAYQFGNFIAGFQGAAYDREFFLINLLLQRRANFAENLVEDGGIFIHILHATAGDWDPLDKNGMPDIKNGERTGWRFSGKNSNCECSG